MAEWLSAGQVRFEIPAGHPIRDVKLVIGCVGLELSKRWCWRDRFGNSHYIDDT